MRDKVKRTQIFRYLNKQKIDIACLQEFHTVHKDPKIFRKEYGGKIIFNHGTSNSKGVAILFRNGLDVTEIDSSKDSEGRILIVLCKIQGTTVRIINTYSPNEDNPNFFVNLFQELESCSADYKMIVGDLNVWLDP